MAAGPIGRQRALARSLVVWLLGLSCLAGSAQAQQYESEVRELDGSPVLQQQARSEAEMIAAVEDDPYALALTLRELAAKAVREGRNQQAAEYMERAVNQNALAAPVQEEMRQILGQLYINTGDYREVISSLGAKARRADASAEIKLAVGSAYAQLGQYRQALPLVRDALRKQAAGDGEPSNEGLQIYAVCLLETGRFDRAAPILERLVRAEPDNKEGWVRLAAVQVKRKDYDRAAAVLELAHRQGMLTSPDELRQLARMFMRAGAPYEAGALLQGWVESGLLPNEPANLRLIAQAWASAKEAGRAITALESLASADPSGGVYLQLGRLQSELGRWDEAGPSLARALQLGGPDVPRAQTLVALGLARYQIADVSGAQDAFRQAARSAETRRVAQQWLDYLSSGRARQQALEATSLAVARRESGGTQSDSRFTGMQRVIVSSNPQAGAAAAAESRGPTPVGARGEGNADGTIPPYTGGIRSLDVPLETRDGDRLVNPFAGEAPRLVIDRSNYTQHADKLSEGQQEMLRRFNGYKIRVFPTHRTVKFDPAIEAASQANQESAKLLESDSISGARLGFPFIDPNTGAQVMWNHRLRPRGRTIDLITDEVVWGSGSGNVIRPRQESILHRYGDIENPAILSDENMLLYYVTFINNVPAVGRALAVVHETADQNRDRRRIWVGAGLGRMRRIPPVGFDFPRPGSEGLAFVDQIDMYNGSFSRYVWKLRGRRELIVPYNAYDVASADTSYDELLGEKYLNPDITRYETHRVWVVEAEERRPAKHTIGKRVFYVDEDSWDVLLVDVYDRAGNLWQLQEAHAYYDWVHQVVRAAPLVHYDFKRDAYYANRLVNETRGYRINESDYSPSDFFPSNVRQRFR